MAPVSNLNSHVQILRRTEFNIIGMMIPQGRNRLEQFVNKFSDLFIKSVLLVLSNFHRNLRLKGNQTKFSGLKCFSSQVKFSENTPY